MQFRFSLVLYYLNALLFSTARAKIIRSCVYHLDVWNDGPVTLDVPATVSAQLACADGDEEYLFVFRDDEGRSVSVSGHRTARATFVFTGEARARDVRVSAYLLDPQRLKVASAKTTVQVQDSIPGALVFPDTVVESWDGGRFVATGAPCNLSLSLRLPPPVLQLAEFSYSWSVGESRMVSSRPYLLRRFKEPGPHTVRASVVARVPAFDGSNATRYKWGYFDAHITAKNSFSSINITGNTYLQHGQLLNLEISCSGSGPVEYCWKVLPPSANHTNLTCSETVSVLECSFPILYYFQESGDFQLALFIDNLVSAKQRNVQIHIYDVSLRPQLSTVIIPMVCTVLVLLIVAGAVVAHVTRHGRMDVETADFDFMVADAVVMETSWERMRRSILQLLQVPYIYYATQVNYGTLIRGRQQ